MNETDNFMNETDDFMNETNNSVKETVIVVSPKGYRPDFIYQNGAIVKQVNVPALPPLLYHYGCLVDSSNSPDQSCDRIIISSRPLKQGQILTCEPTSDVYSLYDRDRGATISYILTYDAGNRGAEREITLYRSYRSLDSTRKNIRRYCDLIYNKRRFDQFNLPWRRVIY